MDATHQPSVAEIFVDTGITDIALCPHHSPPCSLVNASSGSGLSALHCACWAGAADLVKLLVNSGARLDAATHR
jgi:hypothetical protein